MNIVRLQILESTLSLPNYHGFVSAIGARETELADKMFKAMWYSYLKNKGNINLTYWSDRFNNPKAFNIVLMSLSNAKWITSHSIPARNWAEAELNEDKLLEYVTPDELESVRAHKKYFQYVLKHEESTKSNITRVNGSKKNTGLIREGFMKAGNTEFTYNQQLMYEYQHIIQLNLTKSMDKIAEMCPNLRHDRATYDKISIDILDYHLTTDDTFTMGNRDSDSRGRNIQGCLDKVANHVSCKDFRALLTIN